MSTWLSVDEKTPLVLRKEVIYEGEDFIKGVWLSKSEVMTGVRFDVTPMRLEELARQVTGMVNEGKTLPLTRGHAGWMEKENRLGKAISARVLENTDKKVALFLDFEFDSKAARDEAVGMDVSIGLEDSPLMVGGKVYGKPMRHVAATPVPVIDKLEPWSQPEDTMDLTPILAELQLDNEAALLDGVKSLKSELATLRAKVDNLPKIELSNEAVSPIIVAEHAKVRKGWLELAVAKHEISPVVAKEIAGHFSTDARVGLELSHSIGQGDFDVVLKIAKLASEVKPIAPKGGTIELSHDGVTADETQAFLEKRRKAKAEFDAKNK